MDQRSTDLDALENSTVYDSDNKKLGTVGQIYLDGHTEEPKFVTVNTGLFGTKETFVPYDAASHTADGLTVPFTKDFIKDAPNIEADGPLSAEDQQRIFDYYESDSGGTGAHSTGTHDQGARSQGTAAGGAGAAGAPQTDAGPGRGGHVDSDAEVTAKEERLNVGTQQQEAGQARLRKRVRTEHETVEVPVEREELVVERENIDPDSPDARTTGGITDDADSAEETVTLHEERPVVDKETVATEKVNVGKRTVQDTETVEGDLRKEEIDVEGEERPDTRR